MEKKGRKGGGQGRKKISFPHPVQNLKRYSNSTRGVGKTKFPFSPGRNGNDGNSFSIKTDVSGSGREVRGGEPFFSLFSSLLALGLVPLSPIAVAATATELPFEFQLIPLSTQMQLLYRSLPSHSFPPPPPRSASKLSLPPEAAAAAARLAAGGGREAAAASEEDSRLPPTAPGDIGAGRISQNGGGRWRRKKTDLDLFPSFSLSAEREEGSSPLQPLLPLFLSV